MKKVCSKCRKIKPLTDFYKNVASHSKDGRGYYCKECCRKLSKKYKKRYLSNPLNKVKSKYYNIEYYYGLNKKQHEQLYLKQNGCCAICKKSTPYNEMQTDHNHITGIARGLLCRRCNPLLAGIEDRGFLEVALEYLKGYK